MPYVGRREDVMIMTPSHPNWETFCEQLSGKAGCNFRKRKSDGQVTWNCTGGKARPLAKKLLRSLGFSERDIEKTLRYFDEHGGFCDCEILFNVDG